MARMHSYYISNTKDEVKSAYQELNETEFEQVIIQSRLPFDTLLMKKQTMIVMTVKMMMMMKKKMKMMMMTPIQVKNNKYHK